MANSMGKSCVLLLVVCAKPFTITVNPLYMIGVSLLIATLMSTQIHTCVAILRNYNLSMYFITICILYTCTMFLLAY